MPTNFLRSFFRKKESPTLELSIEVNRNDEFIADDVLRGTQGPLQRFDKSTEKIIIPPYYNLPLILNELDGYDRFFARPQEMTEDNFAMMANSAMEKMMKLKYQIERRYELQCAQVLQTGIVTLKNGTPINYRRQAASMPVLTGGDRWTEVGSNPHAVIEFLMKFIRQQGLAAGSTFNVIFGAKAWDAYVNNQNIKDLADNRRYNLVDVVSPIPFGLGGDFLGRASVGTYNMNMWGYQRFYQPRGADKTGKLSYIDDNKIIVLPDDVMMDFGFGATPRIMRDANNAEFPEFIKNMPGDYSYDNYIDRKNKAHVIEVYSAGVAIPTQIDAIGSAQVVD